MNKAIETTENKAVTEEVDQEQESWRRSIPAQVFLNYFLGMYQHIQQSQHTHLDQLPFFRQFRIELSTEEEEAAGKRLLNSWSTEYALRATAELGDDDYLRYALHWTFPQAYYSILAGLQAFLCTLGVNSSHERLVSRETGRLVLKGAYPDAVGYYASGSYPHFSINKLPFGHYKPGLHPPEDSAEAQAQIGQFLRTTRKLKAQAVRQNLQADPQTAVRSHRTGKVLEKWSRKHWQTITWRLGYTSYFDLLSRLRISTSNKEIERFVEADIDFKAFHQALLGILEYLNGLHETYVAKAMGVHQYEKLLQSLPAHLKEGFAAKRFEDKIKPLLKGTSPDQLHTAA